MGQVVAPQRQHLLQLIALDGLGARGQFFMVISRVGANCSLMAPVN